MGRRDCDKFVGIVWKHVCEDPSYGSSKVVSDESYRFDVESVEEVFDFAADYARSVVMPQQWLV